MQDDDLQAPPGPDDGLTEYDPQADPDNLADPNTDPDPNGDPANDPPPAPTPPVVERKRVTPTYETKGMTAEQRSALATRFFDDPIGVLDEYSAFRETQRDNATAATEFNYADYQRRAPEFFAENAPAIKRAIALLKPEQRGDPNAIGYAMLHAVGQDAEANGGDVIAAIQRAADQLKGVKSAPAARRQPDPPSTRTPSGGSTRPNPGAARTQQRSTPSSVEARLAASFGRGAARELIVMGEDDK